MQARVKQDYRWKAVQAGGREFVKSEWRDVPQFLEAEISGNSLLDNRPSPGKKAIQEQKQPDPERVVEPVTTPEDTNKPAVKRTSRSRKAVTK